MRADAATGRFAVVPVVARSVGAGFGVAWIEREVSVVGVRVETVGEGEPIGLDDVDTRVRWLLDLISGAEARMLSRLWQPATFDVLAAGVDRQGRKLATQGHVTAARLGWTPHYPDGLYIPSRVTRVVTAQAMATLRTLTYRDTAITALSARFDPATGRIAPPTAAADWVPPGFARGVRRQLIARSRRDGDAVPSGRLRITDMQRAPDVAAMARLSAADRQLAHITVTDAVMTLTVKLPTTAAPTGRAQWRRVRLTAAITTENSDGLSSDFRGFTYDDRGLGTKLARLQTEGELLHRKAARLTQLATNAEPEARAQLEEKIAVLDAHREAVGAKRGRINRELGFHFARQTADYATAASATVIAVEDLTTLETRGHGRVNNNRAAQSARRKRGHCPRAHRRGCRHHGGVGAGPRILRTVSGLRRTPRTPRRVPHRVVFRLPGRRQPGPYRRGESGQTRPARQRQGDPAAGADARGPGRRARAGPQVPGQERTHPEQAAAPPGPPQPAHRDTAGGGDSEQICSCTSSVGVGHGPTRTTSR